MLRFWESSELAKSVLHAPFEVFGDLLEDGEGAVEVGVALDRIVRCSGRLQNTERWNEGRFEEKNVAIIAFIGWQPILFTVYSRTRICGHVCKTASRASLELAAQSAWS